MMASSRVIQFSRGLKELRFHFCQTSAASNGVRQFIEREYVNLKKANPSTPILVRECSGIQPKLWARYEYGKELSVGLSDKSCEDISKQVMDLSQNS